MVQEGPTKAEINAVFKRLKSIPANKVCPKSNTNEFGEFDYLLLLNMSPYFDNGNTSICLRFVNICTMTHNAQIIDRRIIVCRLYTGYKVNNCSGIMPHHLAGTMPR